MVELSSSRSVVDHGGLLASNGFRFQISDSERSRRLHFAPIDATLTFREAFSSNRAIARICLEKAVSKTPFTKSLLPKVFYQKFSTKAFHQRVRPITGPNFLSKGERESFV